MSRPRRRLVLVFAALVAAGAPATSGAAAEGRRDASEQRAGDEAHPQILAEFGGEVADPALRAYVDGIGRRIAAVTEEPEERWTFTVLDSPVVNAFALPGGYVYVTRGILALANNEAELAGVIGHEIGHVTASHGANRQERAGWTQLGVLGATILGAVAGLPGGAVEAIGQLGGMVGQAHVASYSREQELEADRLGVSYLAKAGWDPRAQAEFLASLRDETALQAAVAGQAYNPNRVDFFASHPATAERVREAARAAGAEAAEDAKAPRNRARFLRAIDGMIYGDSPAQGFVRGARFLHPELRFAFEAPEGFVIRNAAAKVAMAGPEGAGIVFDGDAARGRAPDAYLEGVWAPGLAKAARTGALSAIRRGRISGLDAASATIAAETGQGVRLLRLTAIRDGETMWRFMGVQPQGADRIGATMDRAPESFVKLSEVEAARLTPRRIRVHEARAGETLASLARLSAFEDRAEERLRVLNGMGPKAELREGRKLKLVVE